MLHNTPSGSVDIVTFELLGLEFQAISAGPLFKFNPSISFLVMKKLDIAKLQEAYDGK
jgi:predicted 3-demethylubiquinone-9 3-methyltransferase (glyoxalase superfamily)